MRLLTHMSRATRNNLRCLPLRPRPSQGNHYILRQVHSSSRPNSNISAIQLSRRVLVRLTRQHTRPQYRPLPFSAPSNSPGLQPQEPPPPRNSGAPYRTPRSPLRQFSNPCHTSHCQLPPSPPKHRQSVSIPVPGKALFSPQQSTTPALSCRALPPLQRRRVQFQRRRIRLAHHTRLRTFRRQLSSRYLCSEHLCPRRGPAGRA